VGLRDDNIPYSEIDSFRGSPRGITGVKKSCIKLVRKQMYLLQGGLLALQS
jgi:hypothetical protein